MARENTEEWAERLLQAEELLSEAYEILHGLHADLKAGGHKKDYQALAEPLDRLARYGRLFGEMRQSWGEPVD